MSSFPEFYYQALHIFKLIGENFPEFSAQQKCTEVKHSTIISQFTNFQFFRFIQKSEYNKHQSTIGPVYGDVNNYKFVNGSLQHDGITNWNSHRDR